MRNKTDQVDKGVGMPADVAAIGQRVTFCPHSSLTAGAGPCSGGRYFAEKGQIWKRILVGQGAGIFLCRISVWQLAWSNCHHLKGVGQCKLQKNSCVISKVPWQPLFLGAFQLGPFLWIFVCINFLKLYGHHGNWRNIALWFYNFPCDLEGKETQRKQNVTIAKTFKSDVCPSFWIGGKNVKILHNSNQVRSPWLGGQVPSESMLVTTVHSLKRTRPITNCFLRRLILSSLVFG